MAVMSVARACRSASSRARMAASSRIRTSSDWDTPSGTSWAATSPSSSVYCDEHAVHNRLVLWLTVKKQQIISMHVCTPQQWALLYQHFARAGLVLHELTIMYVFTSLEISTEHVCVDSHVLHVTVGKKRG